MAAKRLFDESNDDPNHPEEKRMRAAKRLLDESNDDPNHPEEKRIRAAKRLLDESNDDTNRPEEKRMRTNPSITTVIREAQMANALKTLCANLEPLLRRVVKEEVDRIIRGVPRAHSVLYRSPSMQIQAIGESSLQLVFRKKLKLPIFTGSKIEDEKNSRLQILLMDTNGQKPALEKAHPFPIKVEIVVLNGDFPGGDCDDWTADEFNNSIVRERAGKRPLLAGELMVTMRDGFALVGEIEFTDNSSWIRSRHFRIGARVAQETSRGRRIKEAMTEAFSVRDHRGELYKKHYPPALSDEVWRLEKIGKDGAFHRRLSAASIATVQDFLKSWIIHPDELRKIVGAMSDRVWEVTIKHAFTCDIGSKRYVHRDQHSFIVLNSICQVEMAVINGRKCSFHGLAGATRAYLERLIEEAYRQWNTLDEIEAEALHNDYPLLQYDPMVQAAEHDIMQSGVQHAVLNMGSIEMGPTSTNVAHLEFDSMSVNPLCLPMAIEERYVYNTSDMSSDDDSAPHACFNPSS